MVKKVRQADALKFVRQAEEFLQAAVQSYESGRYNAATFSAIQSTINANDALTIYYLGQRASADHREGLKLHADVVKILNDDSQRSRLSNAFEMRVDAGYRGDSMRKGDAEKAIKASSRFVDWVKNQLK
jgi:HEPN domain-containing protein